MARLQPFDKLGNKPVEKSSLEIDLFKEPGPPVREVDQLERPAKARGGDLDMDRPPQLANLEEDQCLFTSGAGPCFVICMYGQNSQGHRSAVMVHASSGLERNLKACQERLSSHQSSSNLQTFIVGAQQASFREELEGKFDQKGIQERYGIGAVVAPLTDDQNACSVLASGRGVFFAITAGAGDRKDWKPTLTREQFEAGESSEDEDDLFGTPPTSSEESEFGSDFKRRRPNP